MDLQAAIVFLLIAAATVSAFVWIVRKARSFSLRKNCGNDCGCSTVDE